MIRWVPLILGLLVVMSVLAYANPEVRWPASVTELSSTLRQLEEAVGAEAWSAAEEMLRVAKQQWEQVQPILALTSDHADLDLFSERLSSLEMALRHRAASAAYVAMAELKSVWQSLLSW